MSEFAAIVIATFVTVPLIALYTIYILLVKTTKKKQYSFKIAVDSTTIFFIVSVYFLFSEIWGLQVGWHSIFFVLLTATFFTVFHWKKYEDIDIKKVFRGVWRLQFVVFFLLYIVLVLYGLFYRIY
ncbi:DUF3397 domain-containing protein [Salipaludibacillus sp. HK11]|uniref:DUF3397 domain-containing protein n=1 Tax=Salipaludibacillus sp. HK11 TaxID=3394320 RepID=UPI0039FB8A8A